jgi:hypothetical protein
MSATKWESNPIDTGALRLARTGCNGGRHRRFSVDGARAEWYRSHRAGRFARRFT